MEHGTPKLNRANFACTRVFWNTNQKAKVSGRIMDLFIDDDLRMTVLTNEPTLDEHLEELKRYQPFGGDLQIPGGIDPTSRFVRTASFLKTLPAPRDEREALALLRGVMLRAATPFGAEGFSGSGSPKVGPTRWLVLYDLANKVISFLAGTNLNSFQMYLSNLDFIENAKVLQINLMDPDLVEKVSRELAASGE